jgi:hypothetical protein
MAVPTPPPTTTTMTSISISDGLPNYIKNMITGVQRIQQLSGLSRRLHYDADGAPRRIGLFDGKRNPLTLLVNAQNHELARFLFASDARRFQDEAFDARDKELCVGDLEHENSVKESHIDSEWSASPASVTKITTASDSRQVALDKLFLLASNASWITGHLLGVVELISRSACLGNPVIRACRA